MDAILNINSSAAAFGDQNQSNNPKRRFFDWTRNVNGIQVSNPKADSLTLYPGENRTIFDGQRTLVADATTAWASKSMGNGVYRFTWTGGTAPGMRTQRALVFGPTDITVTINNNSTVTFAIAGGVFSAIQGGDEIYISLPSDPTPSAFNPANTGFWVVLSASPNAITLARPVGQSFNAAAETVSVTNTANGQILAYSSTGVQKGDTVNVTAGFQSPSLKASSVQSLTSNWFEITSVAPLPEEVNIIPGASGVTFYNNAKGFLRVETDQDSLVYLNGVLTGIRIMPNIAGDPDNMGWFEMLGSVWTLSVLNRSQYQLNCNVFSAE